MSRSHLTLLTALLLIGLLAWLRPAPPETGLSTASFWTRKMLWEKEFDVVLAGDSRMYRGLSPGEMRRVFGGYRIANFGFSACGFGKHYLARLPRLFDPASRQKILVMGITPNSLTEKSAEVDNSFLARLHENRLEQYANLLFGDFLKPFDPYNYRELRNALKNRRQGYFQHYYEDGWVASYKLPEDPGDALDEYRKNWSEQKVSRRVEAELIATVKKLTASGIRVYGFRPPTTQAMYELESAMSGFDEAAFRDRFQKAGGIWLDFPLGRYPSYDGSHLRRDGAVLLSRDLARAIRNDQSTRLSSR